MVASAPNPPHEAARLDALHGYEVLDTPPDNRFDLFTRLATWLFDAPIGAINFVDSERTFYKSLIGFDRYEPRRVTSICAHAVGSGDDLMIVEDLSRDQRFYDHPLTLRGVRFYAGAILRSDAGHALGTLCAGDYNPRTFSNTDRQRLLELAEGVKSVLDLHRKSIALTRAAMQDPLTGLWNRRAMRPRIEAAVRTARPQNPCTLLYLDVDRFKAVNDCFGHATGDALLCAVARRLTASARTEDIVARIAGDEFAILLADPSPIGTGEAVARRVLDAFTDPFIFMCETIPISTSIGIATCSTPDTTADRLLDEADRALYAAKQGGRNRYWVSGMPTPGHKLELASYSR